MKKKIVWLVVSCLMVAALVLASCAPAVVEEEVVPVEEEEVVEEEVAPAVTGPQHGGTLTVLWFHAGLEPQTWDPADCNWIVDPFTSPYMENLGMGDFEKYGPRGTNEFAFTDLEYMPLEFLRGCLAESWELPDDTTVIYHIRQGVYWPDKPGVMNAREMTAEDVAFCWTRRAQSPRCPYYENVESVTAADKYTVVVKLKEYEDNWNDAGGWGYFSKIYPPEVVEAGIEDWRNAVGTGPFMLTDYVSGASLTFERNPLYWDTTTIDGKEYKLPFADRLSWPIIVDESTRLAALRTGKCDIDMSVSWRYKETLEETNPELTRYQWLSTTWWGLAGRMDKAPFDDIRVRRAMSMAVDRQAVIDAQMGGEAVMLGGPFSAGWPTDLYTPLEELPESAQELFEYNPEKAKALMAEAGYPDGFKAEIIVSSTGTAATDMASMIASLWEDNLGIELELKMAEYALYYGLMIGKAHKDMYLMSKGCGDPFAVLLVVASEPSQMWNPAMFDDEHFTEMFEKARGTSDIAEAKRLLKECNVYLIDQCPYVILPVGYSYAYAWPWVHNYYGELNANTRSPGQIHARIWLDRDLRYEMVGVR